jgi:hypothetical protein
LKLGGSPASAQPEIPTNTPDSAPAGQEDTPLDFADTSTGVPAATPAADDKPFDDQPFDAGVQADEATDPKKFIEQLTGKLGQSLRKYSEEQGNPDFELEKFAINSVLSATHTSEMDPQDQGDIIKKVKSSGNDDSSEEVPSEEQPEAPADDTENTFDAEPTEEEPLKELGLGDYRVVQLLDIYDSGSDTVKKILTRLVSFTNKVNRVDFIRDVQEDLDPDDMDYVFDRIKAIGVPIPKSEPSLNEEESIFLKEPKKNNMFQKGSNDKLKETEDLQNGEKSSIFVDKLDESFNQEDMTQPATEPATEPVTKPKVKPDTKEPIQPSRRNKPFLPNVTPDVRPDPKAMSEETPEISNVDPRVLKAEKKKALNYPIYHSTFSSAVQAGRSFAEAKGYTIEDNEWFFRVSTGPRKPDEGNTNRYSIELMKDGKLQKVLLHMQIYNMGNKYELNAYVA